MTDLVLRERGYFNLSSPDVGILDCRLGRGVLRPDICFPLPRFTHAPYGLEISGNHGGQREQAKGEWISLFCLQISFILACFLSIEPLKILWYKAYKTDFLYPLLRKVYLNLQDVDFLLKVSVFYAV